MRRGEEIRNGGIESRFKERRVNFFVRSCDFDFWGLISSKVLSQCCWELKFIASFDCIINT